MSTSKYGYRVERPGKGRKAPEEGDRRAFAKRLRAMLKTLRIDIPEFARRIGTDPRSSAQMKVVRSWVALNAPVIPDPFHFMRVCRGLNASPTYLLFGVGPQFLDAPQPRGPFADELQAMVIRELLGRDRHDPKVIEEEVKGDDDLLKHFADVYDLRIQLRQVAAILGLSSFDQRVVARHIEVMVVRENTPTGRRTSAIQATTDALRQHLAIYKSLDGFNPAVVLNPDQANGPNGRDGQVRYKSVKRPSKRKSKRKSSRRRSA